MAEHGWGAPPDGARTVVRVPHLGDCDRTGALRLDALVGIMQDIAGDDARLVATCASAAEVSMLVAPGPMLDVAAIIR